VADGVRWSRRTVARCSLDHLEHSGITSGPLFLTKSGKRPSEGNYWRALSLASERARVEVAFYPYLCRHFAASHWLSDGIKPPQVAQWLGNSVSVLHSTYAHVIRGGEERALAMMRAAFGQ